MGRQFETYRLYGYRCTESQQHSCQRYFRSLCSAGNRRWGRPGSALSGGTGRRNRFQASKPEKHGGTTWEHRSGIEKDSMGRHAWSTVNFEIDGNRSKRWRVSLRASFRRAVRNFVYVPVRVRYSSAEIQRQRFTASTRSVPVRGDKNTFLSRRSATPGQP